MILQYLWFLICAFRLIICNNNLLIYNTLLHPLSFQIIWLFYFSLAGSCQMRRTFSSIRLNYWFRCIEFSFRGNISRMWRHWYRLILLIGRSGKIWTSIPTLLDLLRLCPSCQCLKPTELFGITYFCTGIFLEWFNFISFFIFYFQ